MGVAGRALWAGAVGGRSSADADIEPVAEPIGLEGLLPGERLGVRLSQPHLWWLGEELALQGRGALTRELQEAVALAIEKISGAAVDLGGDVACADASLG